MKIPMLLAALIADEIAQPPVVVSLGTVLRIPDELINEVAEVQHEAQLVLRALLFILPTHPPVSRGWSHLHILSAHEGKMNRPGIISSRRGNGAARAAAKTMPIGKAIPVRAARLETSCKDTAGPIGIGRQGGLGSCHHPLKSLVFRHLQSHLPGGTFRRGRPASPQDDAIGIRISGRDALRVKIAALVPRDS